MKLEIIARYPAGAQQPTPLLFIHGMFHAAWCWDVHFLDFFAQQGFCSYAINLRGHGNSEGRNKLRWTGISDFVDDLAEAVRQLPAAPILIGHSMGGFVIQKYLEDHDAPGAVLLSSPPPGGLVGTIIRIARRHPLLFAKTNLTCNLKYIVATPALVREAFFSPDIPEDELMYYFKQVQNESYRAMLDMTFFSRPDAAKVKTPLLILGASRDNMLDVRQIQACAKAYNTEAEIIPDVAHNSMLEQHWKNVADRILVWLKSNLVMNESSEMLQRVHDKLSVGPLPVNK